MANNIASVLTPDAINDPASSFGNSQPPPATIPPPESMPSATPGGSPALDAARAAYRTHPDAMGNDGKSTYSDDGFAQWWLDNIAKGEFDISQIPQDFELLTALADSGNATAKNALFRGGFVDTQAGDSQSSGATPTESLPIEQGILQTILPGLTDQITGDVARQGEVKKLTDQTNSAYDNLGNVLGGAMARFDGAAYFRNNPDVAKAFQDSGGMVNGAKVSADEFAKWHYDTYGKNEGRQPAWTSDQLGQQQANAAQASSAVQGAASGAAAAQLAALQQSISQMQGNLKGTLAAKADALAKMVASLQSNLTALDASQRQNLAQQISSMGQNLEDSIAAQKQALSTEVEQLRGNASEAAQSRLAAIDEEINGLNAAQAPLNAARLQGAEALSTAVNLGLTAAEKDIAARSAAGGFTGGSTMTDAALARATIDARQNAAQAIAAAQTANATDTRDIGVRGATGKYSIKDALAGDLQSASNLGATGGAQLAAALAQGHQSIGDLGATSLRQIGDTTAQNRAVIGNQGASTTYADTVGGADENQALQDSLSKGTYDVSTNLAKQIQDAKNNEALANFNAGNALYPNTVSAAQVLAGLPGARASSLSALLPYGTAGTTNALGTLNWWGTPNNPPSPTVTLNQPDQSGNQLSGLGSNLLGSAFKVGTASNWWATPTKPKVDQNTLNTYQGTPNVDYSNAA